MPKLTHNGETLSTIDWAKRIGLTPAAITNRLAAGWPIQAALSPKRHASGRPSITYTHEGETLTLAQWATRASVGFETLRARIRAGWPMARALTVPPNRNRQPRPKQ